MLNALNALNTPIYFRCGIFPINATQGKGRPQMLASHPSDLASIAHVAKVSRRKVFGHKRLNRLTPKQMFQGLTVALPREKAGNTSGNFLNKIRQIIYSLYRAREITKNVYNNIMDSINLWNLCLWILKIVKHLILTDYNSTFSVK